MSVSSALDVAIGLAFLFFLFSLAVSRINEFIATALNLRYKGLENALRAMLNDHRPSDDAAAGSPVLSADKVLNHALVKPIQQAIQGRFLSSALGKLGLGGKKHLLPAVQDLLGGRLRPAGAGRPGGPGPPGRHCGRGRGQRPDGPGPGGRGRDERAQPGPQAAAADDDRRAGRPG